jgi:N utilization substance protein B
LPARSKARKRAVDILFSSELRGTDPVSTLADWVARADPPVPEYAVELVEGVAAHRDKIDELLGRYAEGWTVSRMPAVDRTVLRLGAYELLWCPSVPDAVAISEAVTLAGTLSTDESPAFVNGLLARLLELKPVLVPGSGIGVDVPAGIGGEHSPADQLLGEHAGALVVDHSE